MLISRPHDTGKVQALLRNFKACKPDTPSVEPNRRRISMEAWSEPNRPKTLRRKDRKVRQKSLFG